MALRVRKKLTYKISTDTTEKKQLFDNVDDTYAEVINDEFTQIVSGTFKAAASGTQTIAFGDITAPKILHIEADGAFTVAIDGGDAITVAAIATSRTGVSHACFSGTIAPSSSILITNSSSSAVLSGVFVLVGDAA